MHNKNPSSGRILNPNFRDLAWRTNILFTNARMDDLITGVPLLKNLIQVIMMWEAGTNYDNAISQRITSGQITDSLGIPATGQDIFCTTMFNYILVDIFASIFGHGKASALIQRGVISSVIDLDYYHLKDWTVLVSKAHHYLRSHKEITALSARAAPLSIPTAEMPHLACFKLLASIAGRYDVTPILRNFATATFNLCILLEGNQGITKELVHGLCSHERRFLPTIVGTRNFEIPLAVALGISPICLLIPITITLRNISKQDIYKIWRNLGNDRPAILREIENLLWLVIIRATLVPDQLEILLSEALAKAMDLLKGGVEEKCKCWLGADVSTNSLAFGYTMTSPLRKGKDGQRSEASSDFPNKKLIRGNETDVKSSLHEPRRLLHRAAADHRSNAPAELKPVVPAVQPRKPSTSNQMLDAIDDHIPLPPYSESFLEFPLSPLSSLAPSPCPIELDSQLPESPSLRIKREIVEIESWLPDIPCPEQKHEEVPTPLLHYLPPPTTSTGDSNHSAASHPKGPADRGPVGHDSLYLSRNPPSLKRLPRPEVPAKNYEPTSISATKARYPVSITSGSSQHSVTSAADSEVVLDISPDLSAKKMGTVVHGIEAGAISVAVAPYPHAASKVDHPQTAVTVMEAASKESNTVPRVDKRIVPNKASHEDSRLLFPTSRISVLAKSPQANPSTDGQTMELGARSSNIHALTREAKEGGSHSSNTYDPHAHEVSMVLTATGNDWSADNRDAEEVLSGYPMFESNSVSTSKRKDDKLVLGRLFDDMEDLKLKMKKYEERNTELELEVHRLRAEMDDQHPKVAPRSNTGETSVDVDMEEPPPRKVPIRPEPPEIHRPPLDPPAPSLPRLQPKHTDIGRFSHPLSHLFFADFESHKTKSPAIGVGMSLDNTSALLPTPDVIRITPSPRSKPNPLPIRAKRKHHVFVDD